MIRDDVCIVREFFEANSTLPVLLDNLSIQKFPHLGLVTVIPYTPADDADPRPSELRVLSTWA
jgi:hypothetical protein